MSSAVPNDDDPNFERDAEIGTPVQAAPKPLDPGEPSSTGDDAGRAADAKSAGVTTDSSTAAGSDSLVIDAVELARLLMISTKTLGRLDAEKKLLPAIRIGRQRRWLRHKVDAWLEAGAPCQRVWERMQSAKQ
jgi:excisionase family DNA binding protein